MQRPDGNEHLTLYNMIFQIKEMYIFSLGY